MHFTPVAAPAANQEDDPAFNFAHLTAMTIQLASSFRCLFLWCGLWALPLFAANPPSGAYPTAGGTGGVIITVTSLEDSGPGSLREALNAKGARTIRFSVGGEIWLKDVLRVHQPFVTIEGETAPSPGITLMGDTLRLYTHDAIIRHIRVRVGALLTASDPQSRDGIGITGARQDGSQPTYNILVENCSVSWAVDENMEIWGANNHDIVIRNCIMAEGLQRSIHPKGGTHSAGLVIGPGASEIVVQGNLFADNAFRNPVICSGSSGLVINNLIYNPGFAGFHVYGRDGALANSKLLVSVIGNVVIAGPNTRPELSLFHQDGLNAGSQIYLADDVAVGTKTFDRSKRPADWAADAASPFVATPPVAVPNWITVQPATEVEASVLAHAGARPADRDEVDKRIVEEVKDRQGALKDFPTDLRLRPQPLPIPAGIMRDYARLLQKYVTPRGVRYAAWKGDKNDIAALQRVVESIAGSKEQDIAFYLNAYNAWMLHAVLQVYPVESVSDPALRFFDANRITVAGGETNFNSLEKEIFLRFKDSRAVIALNRASRGGPDVSAELFTAKTVRTQLDRLAGRFINSEKGVRVVGREVAVSRIFDWQRGQFSKSILGFINTYREHHAPRVECTYQDYDWSLNESP